MQVPLFYWKWAFFSYVSISLPISLLATTDHLLLLAFVFRDTEQLCAAESKLICWQHAYLPLFSTVSVTQLGVCVPWAALNTQQGLQPLPQSLIIFLSFSGALKKALCPLCGRAGGTHGSLPRDGPRAN